MTTITSMTPPRTPDVEMPRHPNVPKITITPASPQTRTHPLNQTNTRHFYRNVTSSLRPFSRSLSTDHRDEQPESTSSNVRIAFFEASVLVIGLVLFSLIFLIVKE